LGLIRLILALFVVLFHCGQFENFKMMQGTHAVQSFYIISGFYMALILNEKYINKKNQYRLFISNRLLKILPAYWIIILLTLIISFLFICFSAGKDWASLNPYKNLTLSFGSCLYIFVSNFLILGQDLSLFMGLNNVSGNLYFTSFYDHSTPPLYTLMLVPQAWSISVEIMFYLVAPFFVRKPIWKIALFTLLAAALKFFLYRNDFDYDPWSYRFFPAEMFFFLLGVFAYKLYAITKSILFSRWIMILFFVTTLIVIFTFDALMLQFHQYIYFLCFSLSIPIIFRLTHKSKVDRVIGEYSYPIYISHVFFKGVYFICFGYSNNVSIPVLIASIFFAFLYNELVNNRLEDFRQRRLVDLNI
jgi:peptidoglycan/LPS O-acetylase OafA/YrhL